MLRNLLKKTNNKYVVRGTAHKSFQPLEQAFENLFIDGYDKNSQLSVYYKGEQVVDLCGSSKSIGNSQIFDADSLTTIYSNSKTVSALLMAKLYDQGLF